MPTHRCCCVGVKCPDGYCLSAGNSFCTTESAERYGLDPSYPVILMGTGTLCCPDIFAWIQEPHLYTESDHLCEWIDGLSDPCGSISLVVVSDTEATVTLTLAGGDTIVWNAMAGYDPLCTSVFEYSEIDSTPPVDCSWYKYICLFPKNSCCEEGHFPARVYITVEEQAGEAVPSACPCATDPAATNYLDAVPDGTWRGIIDLGSCGTTLNLELKCIEHELLGWVMQLTSTTDSGGCLAKVQLANGSNDAPAVCNPFLFEFDGFYDGEGGCCTFYGLLKLTISE